MIVLEKCSNEDEVYMSLFGRGLNLKRYSLKDRIRHIWQILKTGFPYTDELVLSKERVKELIKALTELSK